MLSRNDNLDPGTHKVKSEVRLKGALRRYLLHVPPRRDVNASLPLVVAIHGAFSKGTELEEQSGWSELADKECFLVAYPEGFGMFGHIQHWNGGHCCGKAAEDDIDDVGFIDAVVKEISALLPVDPKRIYITGFSNGGMLTHWYAAEGAVLIAAVAPVSSPVGGRANQKIPMWFPKAPARPVPILMMHGLEDAVIPYGGGRRPGRRSRREYLSVVDTTQYWRQHNGQDGEAVVLQLRDGRVEVRKWEGGMDAADVVLYSIHGWGHQWPGPYLTDLLPEGDPLRGFDAASVIWEFFRKHTTVGVQRIPG